MIFLTTRQNNFWDTLVKDFDQLTNSLNSTKSNLFSGYEVYESENSYKINIDIPGIQKEDISIEIKSQYLTISAERKFLDKNYLHNSRQYGVIAKTFSIPQGLDVSKISAEYENGVLSVDIPKPNVTSLATKIPIK